MATAKKVLGKAVIAAADQNFVGFRNCVEKVAERYLEKAVAKEFNAAKKIADPTEA